MVIARTQTPRTSAKSDGGPSFREQLAVTEAKAARLRKLVAIANENANSGKPISDRIHDLLRGNANMAFTAAEIMELIHVGEGRLDTVRKAIHRLHARGTITRVAHATYRIAGANLEPLEWPTG